MSSINQWSRRDFVATVSRTAGLATAAPMVSGFAKGRGKRRRIALLATEVRKYSHAQHFIDRFLEGYGWAGAHHYPDLELAGLYVDQMPDGDLSLERSARHRVKIYPTVEEALTLGRSKLAVDGVVIIAEHGLYARTEIGQTIYPRHEFFKRTTKVFESSGRSVPVFNDKHLSTDWNECVAMVEGAKRLGFPFMAGSSLPVTWRIPALEIPLNAELAESVSICYGGFDSYDFHGLETAQCMSERRAGGESGVTAVQTLRGGKVWDLLKNRESTRRLFFAALSRSFTCKGPEEYPGALPDLDWLREHHDDPAVYCFEHRDGLRTFMFLLKGLVTDFTYAGLLQKTGEILSCQMYLPMPPALSTLANFFNPLVNHIERMIYENAPPYPIERTLLTSGMTIFALKSLYEEQKRLLTPELKVAYAPKNQSTFWRK
ncbi:MAG TPA: hypothetical protein VMZ27_00760 [Candidatus Saccharimonadales bacterium]|nr:hypothetical protein [Candidatus Saccharimonadales bacterium]